MIYMVKNGAYHVSLTGSGQLFLSKDNPHLTLYKHSDGSIRNEEGKKCLANLQIKIFLIGKLSSL